MISAALLLAATLAAEPRVTMYPIRGKQVPTEIVRHGNELWFVSWHLGPLRAYFGRIDRRGRIRTVAAPPEHMPGLTTHTADGTLWLSDAKQPVLWRISTKGTIDKVPVKYWTVGIAAGPDGNLWCTHQGGLITRWGTDGSEKGTYTIPYDPPMTSSLPPPPGPTATWIVAGPDGAMWFVEQYGSQIGRITMAGEMTLFKATGLGQFSNLVAGADGAIWFATGQQLVGRMTTSDEMTTYETKAEVRTIAADSAGRIWFATWRDTAGYIDKDGSVHEFEVPGAMAIRSMCEGPDGAMWFADQGAFAIGRIELRPPAPRP